MAKPVDKKFGWVIKDFSSLQSEKCYSVPVLISDCKWRLVAFPKGNNNDYLSIYLDVADFESLPCGWRRFVKLSITIVNQFSQKLSIMKESEHCFDGKSTTWGFPAILPLSELHDKDAGFLVNGEVMIVAELDVFEVIGTLDTSEKCQEASELLSKKKEYDIGVESNDFLKKKENVVAAESNDLLKMTPPVKQSNDVNGTKQVENSVKPSSKKKLMWKVFFVFFLIVVGAMHNHEELLAARKRISDLEKLLQK